MEIGKIAFDIVFKLLMEILKSAVKIDDLPFLQRKKIEARLDSSIAEVVGPLVPFLQREGLSPDRSRLLLESCAREFESLMENPVIFFQGGLDGQKIFDALVTKRKVPQELLDEGLVDQYYLFGPRIATVLCQFPAAVRGWETEAWAENYRRLEDISIGIRELFLKVDHMVSRELVGSDELIVRLRRASYQRTTLDYDLTGLRSERPVLGKFDNFFVHPLLSDDDGLRHDTSWKPTVIGDAVNSSGEFISKRNRSIIVASAGSGKSTWTKWLQLEALSGNWGGICLRIELRGFSEKLKLSLGDLIRLEAGVHLADEVTTPVTRQWINRGLVLLILDGFDEIRTGERDSVLHWITELATTNQYCSIIATTRPLTTEHEQQFITQGWKRWQILPFDVPRIQDFITRWYRHYPDLSDDKRNTDSAGLTERLHSDPTIQPLTGNPLLLSTLLVVNYLDGSLPSGRSQLYHRYIEGMLGIWDDRKHVSIGDFQVSLEEKRVIVRSLALRMFFSQADQIEEPQAVLWVSDILKSLGKDQSPEIALDYLRERTGLIVGPGIYSFTHKSIAEYLVATAVLQGDQRDPDGRRVDRLCLFENRDNDQWNTVTFLWAGSAPVQDVEQFVCRCIEAHSLPLAAGILWDQYDKFPRELRRELSLKLLDNLQDSDFPKEGVSWVVFGPETENRFRLRVPTFELRGLTPYCNFHSLFSTLVTDKLIVPGDRVSATGVRTRELFWMYFVPNPDYLEDLPEIVKFGFPRTARRQIWLRWATQAIMRRCTRGKPRDLEMVFSEFARTIEEASGYNLLCALTLIYEELTRDRETGTSNGREAIRRLREIAGLFDVDSVDDALLRQTEKWYSFLNGTRVVDLLAKLLELDESANQEDRMPEVTEKVHILLNRRTLLLAKKPKI